MAIIALDTREETRMPTISMFRGIKVFINWRDHMPPHFHAAYGGCCFSERMRKLFRKNEKNVLRFCNKKAKEKRRLQRVKKPM